MLAKNNPYRSIAVSAQHYAVWFVHSTLNDTAEEDETWDKMRLVSFRSLCYSESKSQTLTLRRKLKDIAVPFQTANVLCFPTLHYQFIKGSKIGENSFYDTVIRVSKAKKDTSINLAPANVLARNELRFRHSADMQIYLKRIPRTHVCTSQMKSDLKGIYCLLFQLFLRR